MLFSEQQHFTNALLECILTIWKKKEGGHLALNGLHIYGESYSGV